MVTDQQVRRLMEEMSKHGQIGLAATKSGMDRKTARGYLASEEFPSQKQTERRYRTRPDPFEEDWGKIETMLATEPRLQANTIFEHLQRQYPGRYQDGQVRTLQRRIKRWRAQEGPPKEVFFTQDHRPGEALQTDFTWGNKLGVTIDGGEFGHLLCHCVLPYSNWESVTVCASESIPALKRGVQTSLFRLGCVPKRHQTDNSTAATHRELGTSKKRCFNEDYLDFCNHFALEAATTKVGAKEQNGDVEVSHRVLKNRIDQRLMLRGSRDFPTIKEYEAWLWDGCQHANLGRSHRLDEEIIEMRPLPTSRFAEYSEVDVRVTSASTISVKKNIYSVASRLIGERVRVRVFDTSIEVYYDGVRQFRTDRLRGKCKHWINYRHVIGSLVRKPGAFDRYRYRDDLFPSLDFRRAYDRLREKFADRKADLHYLRILKLAADSTQDQVEKALIAIGDKKGIPTIEAVKDLCPSEPIETPPMKEIKVDLAIFDELLLDTEVLVS